MIFVDINIQWYHVPDQTVLEIISLNIKCTYIEPLKTIYITLYNYQLIQLPLYDIITVKSHCHILYQCVYM